MTKSLTCHTLVVGGGPGGYPAAIRAGQLGLDTILVEADRLGGTCLIRGCIPSKAIIHAAAKVDEMRAHASSGGQMGISLSAPPQVDMSALRAWKDGIVDKLSGGVGQLLKAANVRHVEGWAHFSNAKTCIVETKDGALEIIAQNVILANGSIETELPFLPYDDPVVISSAGALDLREIPENLAVIGAGYIGLELGIAFSRLGSKVTFIEMGSDILPAYDRELTRPVAQWLKAHNVEVHLGAKATGKGISKGQTVLKFEGADGKARTLRADRILVAVGRRARTQGWGLEDMAVDMDGPFVKVNTRCETSMRGVYAIGDLTGEPMLAHRATAQGEAVAEIIAGRKRVFDPRAIAAVCFTEPEIVSVGHSPQTAKAAGEDVITGKFPMAASGRALSMEADTKGFVRVTARRSDHVVLGIQAVGTHVAELSGEFALAMEMGAVLEDIAHTVHVHPTLSEATHEAVLTALGHPVHIAAPRLPRDE